MTKFNLKRHIVTDAYSGTESDLPLRDLVTSVDMKGKIIKAVLLPALHALDHFRSFRVTPRSQVRFYYLV